MEDVSRVEQTIANLKEALAPHVITNGRNLWVHWRRIDKDALVVVVDVKLPYPGGSTAYYDAVGQCNVLIAKAIQDAGAELCLPTSRQKKGRARREEETEEEKEGRFDGGSLVL